LFDFFGSIEGIFREKKPLDTNAGILISKIVVLAERRQFIIGRAPYIEQNSTEEISSEQSSLEQSFLE
jgi:hypothetical protein